MTTSSNCLDRNALLEFLTDRLPKAETAHVTDHVGNCDECQQQIEDLSDDVVVGTYFRSWQRRGPGAKSPTLGDVGEELDDVNALDRTAAWPTRQDGNTQNESLTHLAWQLRLQQGLTSLGRFEIEKRLGMGGFGVVYLARDTLLDRRVALKLPRDAALFDDELRLRFLREAEAAAKLHHPHIVPVYEAGELAGICYIAVEYCAGPSLAEWLVESPGPVSPDMAVRVLLHLAEAVDHAHHRGILHRDIKPSNILLESAADNDQLPFTPKLTDFGLAKITDGDAGPTISDAVMGTPRYMAPEQADGRADKVSQATDVYALGVVLYELLTGQRPFDSEDQSQLLQQVVSVDARPPRRLVPGIPRDVEAICLKCLGKRPEDRYPTASALAEDLHRVLRGEATRARPDHLPRAALRSAVRHPARTGCIGALAILIGVIMLQLFNHSSRLGRLNAELTTTVGQFRAQRERAEQSERRTRALLYATDIKLASRAFREDDARQVSYLLDRHVPTPGETDQRGFEWFFLRGLAARQHQIAARHDGAIYMVTPSPSGAWLATAGKDGFVRIQMTDSLEPRAELDTGQGEVNGVAFNSDERLLATAGDDGTLVIWDWQRQTRLRTIKAFEKLAFQVVFTPDDRQLVSCGYHHDIRVWDAATGEAVGTLSGHRRAVEAIVLSNQGKTLISVGSDEECRVWDLARRESTQVYLNHRNRVVSLDVLPDASIAASGSIDRTLQVWETDSGRTLATLQFPDAVQSVRFSPDGQWLLAGDRAGCLHRFQVQLRRGDNNHVTLSKVTTWQAHDGRVYSVAMADPEGRVFSAAEDGELRLWNRRARTPRQLLREQHREREIVDACFGHDSDELIVVGESGLFSWDAFDDRYTFWESGVSLNRVAVSVPDRALVAASDVAGKIRVWDAQKRLQVASWDVNDRVWSIEFVPQTTQLAVILTERDDQVSIFDALSGELLRAYPVAPFCSVSAVDGIGSLLAVDAQNDVLLWDLNRHAVQRRLRGHTSTVTSIAFAPDLPLIATGGDDRRIKLWHAATGADAGTLDGHRARIKAVIFSPGGKTLASADRNGVVKLWHLETLQELCDCEVDPDGNLVNRLVFSPDGRRLACVQDATIRVLSALPVE